MKPTTEPTTPATQPSEAEEARIETVIDELLEKVNGGAMRCSKPCQNQPCNVRCSSRMT